MWVMTGFGILMPAIRPPKTVPEDDNRTIQVRSRRAKDLDILRDEYMGDELGPTIATPEFDYNYRAYCTPEAWGRALYNMAQDIDYEKFKPTTDRYNDHELHAVYNSIWGTVCRLNAPWGGKSVWGSGYSGTTYKPGTAVKAAGVDGYVEVAGPPEKQYKGYVWDKPKQPELVEAEPEFADGSDEADPEALPVDPDEDWALSILQMSEEDWDYFLTDEEKIQVASKLLGAKAVVA